MYQIIYLHVTKHHLRCNSTKKKGEGEYARVNRAYVCVRACVRARCLSIYDPFVWHTQHGIVCSALRHTFN